MKSVGNVFMDKKLSLVQDFSNCRQVFSLELGVPNIYTSQGLNWSLQFQSRLHLEKIMFCF